MKLNITWVLVLSAFLATALPASAQAPTPPPVDSSAQTFSSAQLDQLLGPIALYPDPLIAEIMPASTFPSQIVTADRYIENGGDPNAVDQQPWDPSVQALAHYPDVLKWMDDNLNWTTQVGQAFQNQQPDVMAAIQQLRASAYNLGNLQSTPQQEVTNDDGDIQILPVDPDDLYVPYYQPDQVYYDQAYGAPYVTFGVACPIGLWLNGDFDWRNHRLVVWDRDHPRPANWWRQPAGARDFGGATVWRAGNHPGSVVVNRGDRGWGNQPAPIVVRGSAPQFNERPANVARPTPAPAQYYSRSAPETTGAFIGIQNPRDTGAYSERGRQSVQEMPRSQPAPRPAAPARSAPSSGGGGGRSFGRGR